MKHLVVAAAAAAALFGASATSASGATVTLTMVGTAVGTTGSIADDYSTVLPSLDSPPSSGALLTIEDADASTDVNHWNSGFIISGSFGGKFFILNNDGTASAENISFEMYKPDGIFSYQLDDTGFGSPPTGESACLGLSSLSAGASCYFVGRFNPPSSLAVGIYNDMLVIDYETAVVPLPAALPLLLSALGLFGFMGWQRKRLASA